MGVKNRKIGYGMMIGVLMSALLLAGCARIPGGLVEPSTQTEGYIPNVGGMQQTEPQTMEHGTAEVEGDADLVATLPDVEETTEAMTEAMTEESTEASTEAPTEAPTQKPTQAPTQKPTEAPTQKPTEAPTQKPTQAPTAAPTQAPTQAPTMPPTQAPIFRVDQDADVYEKALSLMETNASRSQIMLEYINELRAANGLQPLVLDERLCVAANMRAVEMDYGNYLDHRRYNGTKAFTTISYAGLSYMAAGENIARGCVNAQVAFSCWQNSQIHYNILVSPKYNKVGVGYCNDNGTHVWALQFTD